LIVAEPKPIKEIADSISGFRSVLILGCGTCVTVCLTGGEREARTLAKELSNGKYFDGRQPEFSVETVERQCEADLVETYFEVPAGTDAILSMACGAGVQTVAAVYGELPVIPSLNTTFLGALDEPGIWSERCQGCGDCVLAYTAGICPVARCAKRLFNGPCGGSSNGKCEIGGDVDCAWQLIIDRLKARGRMEDYEKIHPPQDWSAGRSGGPRKMTKIIKNS
jgi:ferredoxin